MKLSALTLSLVATTQAAFTIERDLQTCPLPSATTPCTTELAPVKCGSLVCAYDNQCTANAAGFTPGVCWPSTCVAASSDATCTFESNPVLCGDSSCEYANYCIAEATGFPPAVCEAVNCPAPASGACTLELDPFVCLADGIGLCSYDNGCLATLAGLDPNTGICVRKQEFIANNLGSCARVPADVACTLNYEPVRCGECYYANDCEATAAGLDISDPLTCQSANCARPSGTAVCTTDFVPVICQPDGCAYPNQCNADAAGYSAAVCVSTDCPLPSPEAKCSREYHPHTCTVNGGSSCKFDNLCLAEAAGQSSSNCVEDRDPINPSECPTPPADTACTLEIDEKFCGTNDCFYSNQCLGTAAGFASVECRNVNCPKSTATVEDCEGFASGFVGPVVCGPYSCPYLSSCFANRARWTPQQCTPVVEGCPVPPVDTLCSYEYQPIVCSSSGIASGAPCAYTNSCLAQAAGFQTDEFAGQCVIPLLTTPSRSVPFTAAAADESAAADGSTASEPTDPPAASSAFNLRMTGTLACVPTLAAIFWTV